MRRILTLALLVLLPLLAFAQTTDNTLKFLGIPVDGTEQAMISNLKSKGFRYDSVLGYLTGQFNGESVKVYIHTNHNAVDRVYVSFPTTTSENEIRNRYNRLLSQFDTNDKYFSLLGNDPIPLDEDISYEMSVNDKEYQASYRYLNPDIDQTYMANLVLEKVTSSLSEEDTILLMSMMAEFMDSSPQEQSETVSQELERLKGMDWSPEAVELMFSLIDDIESVMTGQVWFTIHKDSNRYHIGLYYDNLANRAHGEDL